MRIKTNHKTIPRTRSKKKKTRKQTLNCEHNTATDNNGKIRPTKDSVCSAKEWLISKCTLSQMWIRCRHVQSCDVTRSGAVAVGNQSLQSFPGIYTTLTLRTFCHLTSAFINAVFMITDTFLCKCLSKLTSVCTIVPGLWALLLQIMWNGN